ncbi:flagellar assembly protein FliW [Paraclostridium tenue]|uniref:Flagellar assembly factor FliW n=1 Tax=Paraclostridium tenue TaxID=1737 RepID=A0ABP3XCD2_9FIRM
MNITFEKGLPGFENYKTFILSDIEGDSKFKLINSTEEENIGFIAISPFDVKKDYEINLDDETIKSLQIETPKDVLLLNIITLGNTLEKSTVNLKAPIIINIKNNKGKQLILQDDKYQIKEPLINRK